MPSPFSFDNRSPFLTTTSEEARTSTPEVLTSSPIEQALNRARSFVQRRFTQPSGEAMVFPVGPSAEDISRRKAVEQNLQTGLQHLESAKRLTDNPQIPLDIKRKAVEDISMLLPRLESTVSELNKDLPRFKALVSQRLGVENFLAKGRAETTTEAIEHPVRRVLENTIGGFVSTLVPKSLQRTFVAPGSLADRVITGQVTPQNMGETVGAIAGSSLAQLVTFIAGASAATTILSRNSKFVQFAQSYPKLAKVAIGATGFTGGGILSDVVSGVKPRQIARNIPAHTVEGVLFGVLPSVPAKVGIPAVGVGTFGVELATGHSVIDSAIAGGINTLFAGGVKLLATPQIGDIALVNARKTLGLSDNFTPEQLRTAYRNEAKKVQEAFGANPRPELTRRAVEINVAHEYLQKPEAERESLLQEYKRFYDEYITPKRAATAVGLQITQPVFEDFKGVSTYLLEEFKGQPEIITRQKFNEIVNRAIKRGIKKPDLDLIIGLADKQGDKINLTKLAQEAQTQLVPLTPTPVKSPRWSHIGEDFIGDGKYGEIIYQSPIKTSAGDVHFPDRSYSRVIGQDKDVFPNYFSHVRYEDMADGKTRKILETQSDLFQKENFAEEIDVGLPESIQQKNRKNELAGKPLTQGFTKQELDIWNKNQERLSKLQPYSSNDPLAQLRTFREEVKRAAKDGKNTLLIPSGETAMAIENIAFRDYAGKVIPLKGFKKGQQIFTPNGEQFFVTKVNPDGSFSAVPKFAFEKEGYYEVLDEKQREKLLEQLPSIKALEESFGKNDFVYKLNEESIPKEARKMGLNVEGKIFINSSGTKMVPAVEGQTSKMAPGEWWKIKIPITRKPMVSIGLTTQDISGISPEGRLLISKFGDPNLNPEDKNLEIQLFERIAENENKLIEEYNKRFPNYISTDLTKELFPEYNKANSQAVHRPSSYLATRILEKNLEARRRQGNRTVIFTAGGTGSGKSSSLEQLEGEKLKQTPIIFDSNFSNKEAARKYINLALNKEYGVEVVFVNRNIEEAYTKGVLNRDRFVPISFHIDGHIKSRNVFLELAVEFRNNPSIKFRVIDNNLGKNEARFSALDSLQKVRLTEDERITLERRLYESAKEARNRKERPISAEFLQNTTADFDRRVRGRLDPGVSGQLESQRPGGREDRIEPEQPKPAELPSERAVFELPKQPELPDLGQIDRQEAQKEPPVEPEVPYIPTREDLKTLNEDYLAAQIFPTREMENNYKTFKVLFSRFHKTEFEDVEQFKKKIQEGTAKGKEQIGNLFYSQEFTDDEVFLQFADRYEREKNFVPERLKLEEQIKTEPITPELRKKIDPFFLPSRHRTSRAFLLLGNKDTTVTLFRKIFTDWVSKHGVKAIIEPYGGAFTIGTHSIKQAIEGGLKEFHSNIFDKEKYLIVKVIQEGRMEEVRKTIDDAVNRISTEIMATAQKDKQVFEIFQRFLAQNPDSFIGSGKFYSYIRELKIGKEVILYEELYKPFQKVFQSVFNKFANLNPTNLDEAILKAMINRIAVFGGESQSLIRINGFNAFEDKIFGKYGMVHGLEDIKATFDLAKEKGTTIKLYRMDGAEFVRTVKSNLKPSEIGYYFDPPYVKSAKTYQNLINLQNFISGQNFLQAHKPAFDLEKQGAKLALTNDLDAEYIKTILENIKNTKGNLYAYKEGSVPTSLITTEETRGIVGDYLREQSGRVDRGALRPEVERIFKLLAEKELSRDVLSGIKKVYGVTELKNATDKQLDLIVKELEGLQIGDRLLTTLQQESLTEFLKETRIEKDIRLLTKREVSELLGEKSDIMSDGAIVKRLSVNLFPTVNIKEGHPIITRIVDRADTKLRAVNRRLEIMFEKFESLLIAAEKSRKQGFLQQQSQVLIFKKLSGEPVQLIPEEQKVSEFLEEYFRFAKTAMKLERYRTYYIPHIEASLLEKIQRHGLLAALRSYTKPGTTDLPTDILLALENIIGSKKFFRFALPRKGGLEPTMNLRKIFREYATLVENKRVLDQILPEAQAAQQLLLQDKSTIWMKHFLQNIKGRALDFTFRSGNIGWTARTIDRLVDVGYIIKLGGNLRSALRNIIGGEVNNFVYQTFTNYLHGKLRIIVDPVKSYRIIKNSGLLDGSYVEFVGQNLISKGKKTIDHFLYFGMEAGEYELRGSYFLGELTSEEYQTEKISEQRFREILNGIAITQGIYTKVDSPLFVQTVLGRAAMQFNRWRITNAFLFRQVHRDAKQEIKQGIYSGPNIRRLLKLWVTAGIFMYLSFELAKFGWKEGKKTARAGAELVLTMSDILTLKVVVDALSENSTLDLMQKLTFTLQELATYITGGIVNEPQKFEIRNGIEKTYIAMIKSFKDLKNLFVQPVPRRQINPEFLRRIQNRQFQSGRRINPEFLKRIQERQKEFIR